MTVASIFSRVSAKRRVELPPAEAKRSSWKAPGPATIRRLGGTGRRAGRQAATATSKSAVSCRFVKATEAALRQLLARPLRDLDLVALMLDGVHFGEPVCGVALGIGIDSHLAPAGPRRGDTENTTVVTDLLPAHLASAVGKRMRQAYRTDTALGAQVQLEALAKGLQRTHPGAAASLREGLAETLIVLRLGVPPTLARTFAVAGGVA